MRSFKVKNLQMYADAFSIAGAFGIAGAMCKEQKCTQIKAQLWKLIHLLMNLNEHNTPLNLKLLVKTLKPKILITEIMP
ncbi:hypothetical protein Tco_0430288, partial [Tanacetum coccineum]